MPVSSLVLKARQIGGILTADFALISRIAVYGPVCTVVWEGRPVRGVPIPVCDSGMLTLKTKAFIKPSNML